MRNRLLQSFKKLLHGKREELPFTPSNSDIFLVSYPKSGNTWLRHLIGNYIYKGEMDFTNGHLFMPDLHYNPEQIDKITFTPRFIKSHESYRKEYKKVIYVIRDVRSIAISYYYFMLKVGQIKKELTLEEYLNRNFLTGNVPFGDWQEHVTSWTSNKSKSILVIRYEDMLENIKEEFKKILTFCNFPIVESDLKIAIEKSSFEEMKNDEFKNKELLKSLGHNDNSGIPIIREGKSLGWKSSLAENELRSLTDKYRNTLTKFNYEI
jgi:hypothetical protein